MKQTTVHVVLPENWYEVPDCQPRMYRTRSEESGVLQLSLLPPIEPEGDEDLQARLREMIADQPDLGEEIAAATEQTDLGPMATLVYKSPRVGLFQVWLIPAQATLFATYTMGELGRAEYEMRDAAHILRGIRFVSSLDNFEAYSPPPEADARPWWKVW